MPWTLIALALATQSPSPSLASNATCTTCHAAGGGGTAGMAGDSHQGSLMDLSGVDPFFLAAWEIARGDDAEVSQLCAACHFPGATLAGRQPTEVVMQPAVASDLDGIACDLCHRFDPPVDDVGAPQLEEPMGNAAYVLGAPGVKLGPFGSTDGRGHASARGPLVGRSETCGQCHDVTNVLRERFEPPSAEAVGPVPLERTFREWSLSAFGRSGPDHATCQDCHMPPSVGRAATLSGVPADRPLRGHRIVGSTTRAPRMIAQYPALLGAEAPPNTLGLGAFAAATSSAALALLRSAASMGVLIDDEGQVRVRVTNHAGHKLPTGYSEGRRMWLEVSTVAPDGSCVSLGGAWDPNRCEIDDEAPPLQTWEALLGEQGKKSLHFALVDTILADSRIPPKGFVPDADTMPVGATFGTVSVDDGAGGSYEAMAHFDDVAVGSVEALTAAGQGVVVVEARVLFQSTTKAFLRFLVDGAPEAGPLLRDLFLAAGPYQPEEVARIRFAVDEGGGLTVLDGDPVCLSSLTGPAEACLDLPLPAGVVDGGPEPVVSSPDAGRLPDDDGVSGGCRCAAPRTAVPWSALALLSLLSLRRRARTRAPPGG